MGLLDKLVDKIIDSAKKKKQSASVKRAIKNNPALKKAMDNHQKAVDVLKVKVAQMAKEKGIKL
tara:strand:- start:425 stop:616 length:192 start_codon:yes stop_codon:yes gene_type:complete